MSDTDTPQHKHDCDTCVFLGRFLQYDLYYADHGGAPDTVVARYGSEGHEYISGLAFVGHVSPLTEAYLRALTRGIEPVSLDMADYTPPGEPHAP